MQSSNETMAYLAGLFDGEGCITYRQRSEHRKGKRKAYNFWNIRIEINMIEKDTPEYRSGGAYRAMLKLFADNIKNENNS
jgi:hypothetical protein